MALYSDSVIEGAGDLGGGTLLLEGDGGTLTDLGSAAGLHDFATLDVVGGGGWDLAGASTIASGSRVDADGLTLGGTVRNAGTITAAEQAGVVVTGTLVNTGTVTDIYHQLSYTKYLFFDQFISIFAGGLAIDGRSEIKNLGLIESLGGSGAAGISMGGGGRVINGSAANRSALIEASSFGIDMAGAAGTVTNFGTIMTEDGGYPIRFKRAGGTAILLDAGGTVVNGSAEDKTSSITGGAFGVKVTGAAGKVQNFGTIGSAAGTDFYNAAAIDLADGGEVTNGDDEDLGARINGGSRGIVITKATGTIVNFGTVESGTGRDVYTYSSSDFAYGTLIAVAGVGLELGAGGLIVNGDNTDTTALLDSNGISVMGAAGTIRNFGTIESVGASYFETLIAVSMVKGGTVINGSATDTAAVIHGTNNGIIISGAAGTVENFGTIETWTGIGTYVYYSRDAKQTLVSSGKLAVDLADGGLIINGSEGDTTALLISRLGVSVTRAAGTIQNFGTIIGDSIDLAAGGSVVNGSASDSAARISGDFNGVYASGGTVRNGGTILATATASVSGNRPSAIHLKSGGTIVNEASAALIRGYLGIDVSAGAAIVTNFGTIAGTGTKSGIGILIHDDGVIINGSTSYRKATIAGVIGVSVGSDATITDFGTIDGTGGTALAFHGAGGTLIVEGGAAFAGKVAGDGGTLELDRAGGTGTIAGIGVAASASGFTGFTDIRVASSADWTAAGSNTIAAAATLINDGTLIATGTLTALGAVAGTGLLDLGGTARLNAEGTVSAGQTIGFAAGGGTLAIGDAAAFHADVAGFGEGDGIDLTKFGFSAAETLHFTENAAKTQGTLVVTDGSLRLALTLFGHLMAAGFSVKSDGSGGSLITYVPPPGRASAQLASAHG